MSDLVMSSTTGLTGVSSSYRCCCRLLQRSESFLGTEKLLTGGDLLCKVIDIMPKGFNPSVQMHVLALLGTAINGHISLSKKTQNSF